MKFILLVIAVLLGFRILQGLVMMFEQKIGGSIIVMAFLVPFLLALGFFIVVYALEKIEKKLEKFSNSK